MFKSKILNFFKRCYTSCSNIILMAFASGNAGEESVTTFKRYKGIAAVSVLAINPNKAKLKELTGRELLEEPKYLFKSKEGKDQVKIDFLLQTDPEFGNKINQTFNLSVFMTNEVRVNSAGDKFQVIDNYGNTAWVTKQEYQTKTLPPNVTKLLEPYRPALAGEEDVIHILKTWLNIPESHHYDVNNSVWKVNENLKAAEAYLTQPAALFKGDFKELLALVTPHKDYTFKVCVGVKTADTGKKYQDVYNKLVLKRGSTFYDRFAIRIKEAQSKGAYPNTIFSFDLLQEENVEATNLQILVKDSANATIPSIDPNDTSFLHEINETPASDDLPF